MSYKSDMSDKSNLLFVLGNAPELAEEELAAIYPNYQISGGIIKVAEIFDDDIVSQLAKDRKPGDRINFGFSGDQSDPKAVKRQLEEKGFKARFVLPQDGVELSSVVVAKQKVQEIYSVGNLRAKTVWVQDFESWDKRDYGRPQAQGHIGMLPPKVARMMVNIGIRGQGSGVRLLDPFCGVGTILAEGLVVGAKVIGSDFDARQIQRTKENLEWLAKEYSLQTTSYRLLQTDARTISTKLSEKVDAIVTEPDLGPTNPATITSKISQVNNKLLGLYLDCLSNWRNILKIGGRVVIAIPSYIIRDNSLQIREDSHVLHDLIDKAKIMGYSLVSGPFPYFRRQATVRRNICVFSKN